MKSYDVGIIGAGPAGMMAAITAARAGKRVILIEKNDSVGRKLLATGNGRCNLTNRNISLDRYHGADSLFIETVLDRFDPAETIKFFESMGVLVKEEDNGRIFPRSNQASTIVETLNQVLSENKVVVKAGSPVKAIEKENRFTIRTEDGDIIVADIS
jgi:predicted Rossmann fold flavoprotein